LSSLKLAMGVGGRVSAQTFLVGRFPNLTTLDVHDSKQFSDAALVALSKASPKLIHLNIAVRISPKQTDTPFMLALLLCHLLQSIKIKSINQINQPTPLPLPSIESINQSINQPVSQAVAHLSSFSDRALRWANRSGWMESPKRVALHSQVQPPLPQIPSLPPLLRIPRVDLCQVRPVRRLSPQGLRVP